jgi:hypothetical protein
MYEMSKKCPFNGKVTMPMGARLKYECREQSCRMCVNGRCVILATYFHVSEMLDKMEGRK